MIKDRISQYKILHHKSLRCSINKFNKGRCVVTITKPEKSDREKKQHEDVGENQDFFEKRIKRKLPSLSQVFSTLF